MKIKHSGAKYSAIVGIGEKLSLLEKETGKEYLRLNRGIPSVVNINLSQVIPLIDFESPFMKIYPPNTGMPALKSAINKSFFQNSTTNENITVTAGGMNALDLVFKTLNTSKIYLPEFYWGAYANIMRINNVNHDIYFSFDDIKKIEDKNVAVLVCDPNNPIGNKYDDKMLLKLVSKLDSKGITVIWDSPYRKLFFEEDDNFYAKLSAFENVIITDSFSKSVGLSGQRLGFIHSINKDFNKEIGINILYENNGINAFAQILVEKLLTSKQGVQAAKEFRRDTIKGMNKNLELLKNKGLLAEKFYQNSTPVGIFVVVNKSEEELLQYNIGSVSLSFFTSRSKELAKKYARICIAVPHKEFKKYFEVF